MSLLSGAEIRELESRAKSADTLRQWTEGNKAKWFVPNGGQDDFLQKLGKGDVFVGVFSAANGVGKTALLVNVLLNFIRGKELDNEWFNYPTFRQFKFPHRARIASTKKNVEEVGAIQTEIKNWFPKGEYESAKKGKIYDSEYKVDDWVFDIMTYEQDVREFESATLGLMIFDEPPPLNIFNACIARMRRGGIILLFMTPLDTGGELLEDLQNKEVIEYEGKTLGKVAITYADIESNCKEHGVNGILEHSDIIQMTSFYDDEEREARMNGKPVHLVGRIYPDFENDEPYVCEDQIIPQHWPRCCLLDPHDAIPFALSWFALDDVGVLWIYDEFPAELLDKIKTTRMTYIDYANSIRQKEGRDRITLRLIDPFFGNKRFANDGKTPKEELADLGLDFDDGDTSGIDVGHKRVREFLKYDKKQPVNAINHPRIRILKRCKNHIRSLTHYKRKFHRSGEVKDKIVLDETFKHYCDNIRHMIMKYEDFVDTAREQTVIETDHMMGGGRGGW